MNNLLKIIFHLFIFLISYFYSPLYGQNNKGFKVLDLKTHKPLVYAVAKNLIDSSGFYTNQSGGIDNNILKGSVEISNIGYYPISIDVDTLSEIVYLKPKYNALKEHTFFHNKKRKSKEYGYFNKKVKPNLIGAQKTGTEIAVLIRNPQKEECILKKLFIAAGIKNKEREESHLKSIFKINLYAVKGNNEIGYLINDKPLVYSSDVLEKKTVLDVYNENIIIPENGAFISIEWIAKFDEDSKNLIKDEYVEPYLCFTNKPEGIVVYKRNVFKDKWARYTGDKKLKSIGINHYIPRISIEVVY